MIPHDIRIAHPDKLYIGGQWVESAGGKSIEIVSPNSEDVIARVAEAVEADMDRAVAAARKAFDEGAWPTLSPAERGALVRRMGEELQKREPELARAWTLQVGGLASFAPIMTGGATASPANAGSMMMHLRTVAGRRLPTRRPRQVRRSGSPPPQPPLSSARW